MAHFILSHGLNISYRNAGRFKMNLCRKLLIPMTLMMRHITTQMKLLILRSRYRTRWQLAAIKLMAEHPSRRLQFCPVSLIQCITLTLGCHRSRNQPRWISAIMAHFILSHELNISYRNAGRFKMNLFHKHLILMKRQIMTQMKLLILRSRYRTRQHSCH